MNLNNKMRITVKINQFKDSLKMISIFLELHNLIQIQNLIIESYKMKIHKLISDKISVVLIQKFRKI